MKKLLVTTILAIGLGGAIPATQASAQDTPMLGQMTLFAGNFAPRSWAFCDGQLLAISTNTALFSLLGTTYGGDGVSTFALPDMRGRSTIGPRQGPGLSNYNLGQTGGQEQVTLVTAQMPAHQHSPQLKGATGAATVTTPANGFLAAPAAPIYGAAGGRGGIDTTLDPGSIVDQLVGGGQSHENRPPFLGVNCIIALQGIYPSRN